MPPSPTATPSGRTNGRPSIGVPNGSTSVTSPLSSMLRTPRLQSQANSRPSAANARSTGAPPVTAKVSGRSAGGIGAQSENPRVAERGEVEPSWLSATSSGPLTSLAASTSAARSASFGASRPTSSGARSGRQPTASIRVLGCLPPGDSVNGLTCHHLPEASVGGSIGRLRAECLQPQWTIVVISILRQPMGASDWQTRVAAARALLTAPPEPPVILRAAR